MDQFITVSLPDGTVKDVTEADLPLLATTFTADFADMCRIAINEKYLKMDTIDNDAMGHAKAIMHQQELQSEALQYEHKLQHIRMRAQYQVEERALRLLPTATGFKLNGIDRAHKQRRRILRNIELRNNGDETI